MIREIAEDIGRYRKRFRLSDRDLDSAGMLVDQRVSQTTPIARDALVKQPGTTAESFTPFKEVYILLVKKNDLCLDPG